jgi:hypothetical protein
MKNDVLAFFRNDLGLGDEDSAPLYESFMESFGDIVRSLRAAPDSDFMELRRITHAIIGFSQNVGAIDLFEAAKSLNASAKAADTAACHAGAEQVISLYEAYLNG